MRAEKVRRIRGVIECFLVNELKLGQVDLNSLLLDENIVVIGGAALFILGYRDDFDDIDLIVPKMGSWYSKTTHLGVKVDAGGQYCLSRKNLTEEVLLHSIVVHGIQVMAPEDILAQKMTMDRDKDQADILALKANGIRLHARHKEATS